ncbi:MAG: hypothetical protein Q8O56_08250 [Solirubrobacteraceae bacterium]|nr:hypothetical protein [Solirubrobacteraceae bacterium]
MTAVHESAAARPPYRRSLLAVLLIAALAVFAAGCGGSDDDDGDDDAQQSVAAFNAGAKAATTETTSIGREIGSTIRTARTQTNAQLAAKFTNLAARARAVVDKLNALDPPDASRAKVTALVGALSTGAQDLDAIATAARAGDAAAARSATQTLARDSPAIEAAKDALDADVGGGAGAGAAS